MITAINPRGRIPCVDAEDGVEMESFKQKTEDDSKIQLKDRCNRDDGAFVNVNPMSTSTVEGEVTDVSGELISASFSVGVTLNNYIPVFGVTGGSHLVSSLELSRSRAGVLKLSAEVETRVSY